VIPFKFRIKIYWLQKQQHMRKELFQHTTNSLQKKKPIKQKNFASFSTSLSYSFYLHKKAPL